MKFEFGIASLALACSLVAPGKFHNNEATAFSPQSTATRFATAKATGVMQHRQSKFIEMTTQTQTRYRSPSKSSSSSSSSSSSPVSLSMAGCDDHASTHRAHDHNAQNILVRIVLERTDVDGDGDGKISPEEVKAIKDGLERELKIEIPQKLFQKLVSELNANGNGYLEMNANGNRYLELQLQLQPVRMISIYHNQLETVRIKITNTKKKTAVRVLNDKEPTLSDKILGVQLYLLPLLHSLWPILERQDQPQFFFVTVLIWLNVIRLLDNPRMARQSMCNLYQAACLDFLTSPGYFLYRVTGSTVIYVAVCGLASYASISLLLGIQPDKIPVISEAVEEYVDFRRMNKTEQDKKKNVDKND